MRVKAKLVYCCCNNTDVKDKRCIYTRDDDSYSNCDNHVKIKDVDNDCRYKSYTTKYIERDYKQLEYNISEEEESINLDLGKERYYNDNWYEMQIEYLYIDDEPIVENYKIIRK